MHDTLTVIKPALEKLYGSHNIGLTLFEQPSESSRWNKNVSLNSNEWSVVLQAVNSDTRFTELRDGIDKTMNFISDEMILECDFCAKIYSTQGNQMRLMVNDKDTPPLPLPPGQHAEPSSAAASSAKDPLEAEGASSDPGDSPGSVEQSLARRIHSSFLDKSTVAGGGLARPAVWNSSSKEGGSPEPRAWL